MGNAFIAVSDDGTAASWNPAGLAQLREAEFSLVHATSRRNQVWEGYRAFDGSSVFTTLATGSPAANIEFASAAVPFRLNGRPVTVQIGWRRLYELGAQVHGDVRRVPVDPTARAESTIRLDNVSNGSVKLWSLAGAVGLTSRLSAGWSLDVYRGGWEDRRTVNELPGILGPGDFVSLTQANKVSGHALNLGLLLAYPEVSVGFVYHGALQADYSRGLSVRSTLVDPFDVSADMDLQFPRSIGVGVAWRPGRSCDWRWTSPTTSGRSSSGDVPCAVETERRLGSRLRNHFRRLAEPELRVARSERRHQLRHVLAAVHAPKALGGFQHPGRDPA